MRDVPGEEQYGYVPGTGLSRDRYELALIVVYQLSIGQTYAYAAKLVKRAESNCKDMVKKLGHMWQTRSAIETVARALRKGYIK